MPRTPSISAARSAARPRERGPLARRPRAQAPAATLRPASLPTSPRLLVADLESLQRTIGNAAVGRLVQRHRLRRRAAEPDGSPGMASTGAAPALQRRGPDAGADRTGPDGLTALATMVVGMAGPLAVQLLLGLGVRDENRL